MPDDRVEGRSRGRVAFATITPVRVRADDVGKALKGALVAGTRIERHKRVWRMGQVRREAGSLVGRLGFQKPDVAEVWDEAQKDFSEHEIQAGYASPFAIDPNRLRVAFQPRLGLIQVMSFTGALQALMNDAGAPDYWRVRQALHDVPFYEWAKRMDRVAQLRIRVERPNPGYRGRERVKQIIEGTNARMVNVVLAAEPGTSLNVNDDFVREAIEHADEDYGTYSAAGELAQAPQRWDSVQEGSADVRDKVPADPTTREIPYKRLRELLGDTSPEEQE